MAFNPAEHAVSWVHPGSDIVADASGVQQWNDASGVAAPPPQLEGVVFGTQTHCAQFMTPDVYGQLAVAVPTVQVVRDELFFGGVYKSDGTLSLDQKQQDFLDAIAASGHWFLLELLWGDADATGHAFALARTAAQRAIFCDYASFVVSECKARGVKLYGVELWNEISGTWTGWITAEGDHLNYDQLTSAQRDANADDYVALAVAVRARLQADHPEVRMAAGADVVIRMDWLHRVIDRGLLDHCDAMVIHPYGTSINSLSALRTAMAAEGYPDMPLWMSEYSGGSTTEERQAFAVRVAAQAIAGKAELICWYLAKPHQGATNSILDGTGAITPVGAALQHFGDLMTGSTYVGPATVPLGVSAEVFDTASQGRVTVLWATNGATIAISGETALKDAAGSTVTPAASYAITASPLLAFGSDVVITEAGEGGGVLADFAAQFKSVQGDPWEYGTYNPDGVFEPATWSTANNRWQNSVGSFHWITATSMHPHVGYWVTVRVKFPAAHRVNLVGNFRKGSTGGDPVQARIRAGSVVLAIGEVANGENQQFDIVADVPADTWIEFSADPGPTNSFDATAFAVTIMETDAALTEIPVDFGSTPPPPPPPTGNAITLIFSSDGIVRWQAPG